MKDQDKNSIKIYNSDKIIPLAIPNNDFLVELPIEIWCMIIKFCGWREKAALKRCCREFNMEISVSSVRYEFQKAEEKYSELYRDRNKYPPRFNGEMIGRCIINHSNIHLVINLYNTLYYISAFLREYPFFLSIDNRIVYHTSYKYYGGRRYTLLFDGGYIDIVNSCYGCYSRKIFNLYIYNKGDFDRLFGSVMWKETGWQYANLPKTIDIQEHIDISKISSTQLDQIKNIFSKINSRSLFNFKHWGF